MMPSGTDRVERNTAQEINRRIAAATEQSIRWHAHHPERIDNRLAELDREWDIERVLEANAASLALAGVLLGVTVNKRWLLLPTAVTAFLLQHAIQGWCPPLPLLRRLGFRTALEIHEERAALKALPGDFSGARNAPMPMDAALSGARI
ncbi:YgaP family membrane protein [Rhodoligotrophos ferricapiens]|uniref:YgaP family membrane protein n=1 Tax=Rhodoligotrophos ferricapiens TaxID=3069264 RepID=UPI00315CA154